MIIWAECLKKSAHNICGSCLLKKKCPLNLHLLGVGGEMIRERKHRQRLILWESRIVLQPSLLNANGEMRTSIWMYWKH